MAIATFEKLHNEQQALTYDQRIRYVKVMAKAFSLGCFLLILLSITGYIFSAPQLYRPLLNGAATNPLTALSVIFISLTVLLQQKKVSKYIKPIFSLLSLVISSTIIFDNYFNTDLARHITPFQAVINNEHKLGLSNSMGINTAIMLACLSLSMIFTSLNKKITSQLLAFIGMAVPMLSIIGYAYGISNFFGEMSILTTTYGLLLALSVLCINAESGAVYALLSPHIGGRIARFQVMLGYVVPVLIGYLFIKTIVSSEVEDLFGLYVVIISWFIIILIISSAIIQERVDEKRRIAEFALLKAATHDSLTGLANRRRFMDLAEKEIGNSKSKENPSCLLMVDIDHFKLVNDKAGHLVGDKVLIEIAKKLAMNVRKTDLVCRLGGEEFAILLPSTDKPGAHRIAEKIRTEIEQTHIEGYTDIYSNVTASIGVSEVTQTEKVDYIISNADKALYTAKETGRNKVVVYEGD